MNNFRRRAGKIVVSKAYFESREQILEIAGMLAWLQFVPTRAEQLYHLSSFEYVGISPRFDELGEGELIPEYTVLITRDKHGESSYSIERADA